MKLHPASRPPRGRRSGAALLLSLLVLIVVILIVSQINLITSRDSSVAANDVTLTMMDLAIESAMLETQQILIDDAAAAGGEEAPEDAENAAAGGGDEGGGSVDSKMDGWAVPQSTNIGDLNLRILIQDEDSKFNILNMLVEDEEAAQDAYDRVVRVIDNFREGTTEDIDSSLADEMARVMRDHMLERSDSYLPRARLLTDRDDNTELGMPLTMREFVVLEPFEERHFRDYFDRDGRRVHALTSFLTIYTSPGFAGSEDGTATTGYGVNVNTAPLAVLNALFDPRDVDTRFWDGILEYRNEEEEREPGEEEVDPMLDEFGNELIQRKYFDDLEELDEVYDWGLIEPGVKDEVEAILTVDSRVFSICITARLSTANEGSQMTEFTSRQEQEQYERSGTHIVRTVRSVVWRTTGDDGASIVPLVRWEVLDHAPLEVLDYDDGEY